MVHLFLHSDLKFRFEIVEELSNSEGSSRNISVSNSVFDRVSSVPFYKHFIYLFQMILSYTK